MRDDELLQVEGLSAGYGGARVVSEVSLTVRRGDFLGLLGANGSGKSTFLRAVTGQNRLLAGTVRIGGIDLTSRPEQAKAQFGYAVDGGDLPENLTGAQYLELLASVRRCGAADWPCEDLVEHFELLKWFRRPIAAYSLGTRMKLSILGALLGTPPLILLDESLNGLDPVASWRVKTVLDRMCRSGRHAVILSTHALETVERICNRAVFLQEGRIVQGWDAETLKSAGKTPGGFEALVMDVFG